MRILLTGGSGSVGKAVVDRLVNHGFQVRVIGRRADITMEGAEYQPCDINDFARLSEVMEGCDAVVHLAAIPNPGAGTPEEVFRVNCDGTFNVFQAAVQHGIRRIVQASSINSTGQFYGLRPAPLHYLPMDEAHPVFATDAYSFSKNVIEEIGDYFWRREGVSSVAYRLPWVAPASQHDVIEQRRAPVQALAEWLMERSPAERLAWFEKSWEDYNRFRSARPYETAGLARQLFSEMPDDRRRSIGAMSNRVNFFTMLDERDSAQAVEKGLTADFEGSHTLFINDSQNWTRIPSKQIVELFYPDVPTIKKDLAGAETVISIDRARQLIGFEPEYTFG